MMVGYLCLYLCNQKQQSVMKAQYLKSRVLFTILAPTSCVQTAIRTLCTATSHMSVGGDIRWVGANVLRAEIDHN